MDRLYNAARLGLGLTLGANNAAGGSPTERGVRLCGRVVLTGKLDPGLTDTEKKLVCGGEDAWKTLPLEH